MTFPQTPLDIQVDLKIDGAWTEITPDVYRRDQITITRGRSNEEGQVGPGSCSLTLNNRSGKYSPRNPTGTYYGKIGRNTPIRVSVNHGTPYLNVADTVGDRGTTVDHASLDITGDIDVRFEAILDDWYPADETFLMGKYSTSGRSWIFTILDGHLVFGWTSDGTTGTFQSELCTAAVVLTGSRRLAVRATLDVDDGSGNHIVTFYTAPSITSGEWTQLGEANVDATTTSIFSGGGALDVGHVGDVFSRLAPVGQILAAEVRSGIGGTVVANPDWTAQTAGTTSFSDGAGRTWTLSGNATIINRKPRFVGEVTSWPPRWDTSGQDIYTPIEAAGILRRLGQGDEAIQSAIRRELGNPALHGVDYYGGVPEDGIVAYWPCEDGSAATVLASGHQGEPGMVITGTMNLAAYTGWAASDALPNLGTDSIATGRVPAYTTAGVGQARCFFYLPQAVGAETTLIDLVTTGTAKTWTVRVTTGGDLILKAFDADVVTILTSSTLTAGINGSKVQIALELFQNGTGVDWTLRSFDLDTVVVESTLTGTLASRTFGRITEVRVGATYGLSGAAFGHVAVANDENAFTGTSAALLGSTGEAAAARIARLAAEEDIPLTLLNSGGDELVGPQKSATLLTLMRDAADVGHGILYEARHLAALQYRGLPTMYNQLAVELTYSDDLMPGLAPTDDDQLARNVVAVQRVDGAWGYAVEEEGAMSVALPPDGMGRYATSVTRNLYNDTQPAQHASWLTHIGTVDELRYPVVRVAVHASPSIADKMMELDCGSRLKILDPTTKLPPGDIDQLVSGYREVMDQFEWAFDLNCQPASPYTVAVLDDTARARIDTSGSALAPGITSTATSLSVATTAGRIWVQAGAILNTNPDFETNLTGWTGAGGGTIARIAGVSPAGGSWVMRVTPDGVTAVPRAEGALLAATAGTSYTASGWLNCASSRSVNLNVNWFNAGSGYISTSSNALTVRAGVWTWLEANFTAPALTAFASLVPTLTGTPPVTDVLTCDQLTLRPAVAGADPMDFPLTILVGGETMTVTAISGGSSPQSFTVGARSVNGVVKSHLSGAALRLAQPAVIALGGHA